VLLKPVRGSATRLRVPGSDWLYLKLYGPTTSDDDVIAGPLRSFGEFAIGADLCDGWFFLRYADPDPHLRIRFHGSPEKLLGPLLEHACGWAADLVRSGDRSRFGFDTYEREVERFGGAMGGIDASEQVFMADSPASAALVELLGSGTLPFDQIALGVLSADDLLAGLGLAAGERLSVYRSMVSASLPGGAEYRRRKADLRHLLEPSIGTSVPAAVNAVLAHRRHRLDPAVRRLISLEHGGCLERSLQQMSPSFVHLHLNRLVGTDRVTENLIVELLRRTRTSLSQSPTEPIKRG